MHRKLFFIAFNNFLQRLIFQNSEMQAEGELRSNLEESDRVRELQDKVAELKAEVRILESFS
jgi:uncharacterized protein YlxW (UPF0749 family)